MKETRFFFVPDARSRVELPQDEANHATRVLRLAEGDDFFIMDGEGYFFRAIITVATNHRCLYKIIDIIDIEDLGGIFRRGAFPDPSGHHR